MKSNLLYVADANGVTTLFVDIDIDEKKTEKRTIFMVETWKPVSEEILSKIRVGSFVIGNLGKVCHFFVDPIPVEENNGD